MIASGPERGFPSRRRHVCGLQEFEQIQNNQIILKCKPSPVIRQDSMEAMSVYAERGSKRQENRAREAVSWTTAHVNGLPGGRRRRRRCSGGEMYVSVQRVCPALRQGIAAIISVRFSLVPAS